MEIKHIKQPIRMGVVAAAILMLMPAAIRADEDPAVKYLTDPAVLNADAERALRAQVARIKEDLPPGYTLRVDFGYSHQTLKLGSVHVVPLSPEGKEDGEERFIGRAERTVPWTAGLRHGIEKEYNLGPERRRYLRQVIPWHKGRMHGERIVYHDNARPMYETTYVDGQIEGTSKAYDYAGRLSRATEYRNGQRHGDQTDYWADTGKPRRILPFVDNQAHGTMREYHENNQLKREVGMRNGLFHGIDKEYSRDGRLLVTRYWLDDDEVDEATFNAGDD